MTEPTSHDVLAVPMQQNDAEAETIGEYLIRLLRDVWSEGEGFDGKRPFGNSAWEYDLYQALVTAGYIEGTLDSDGYLDDISDAAQEKGNRLVDAAIRSLWPRV